MEILRLRDEILRWRRLRRQHPVEYTQVECDKEIKVRLIKQGNEYIKVRKKGAK